MKIINRELLQIKERLLNKGVKWNYSLSLQKYIFNHIKEKNNHAREIKNMVKVLVQVPLSQFIVKNRNIEKISSKIVDKTLTFD